ncbi:MAG: AraC family transcriptional regulator [Paludibacteraceae bacterium]|nr:AraC family transcriptional regulator [Paludibacteraceae bacterium]MBR1381016.1 AraC family transcriptional regulator [Paludibacteraceae bacterium]
MSIESKNNISSANISIREFWHNYHSELFFFLILSALVALSHWLSRFIPENYIFDVVLPVQHGAITSTCLISAWMLFRHSEGMRIRIASAVAMLFWCLADGALIMQDYIFQWQVIRIGSDKFNTYALFVGNFLAWIMLVYPTETLRPRWLTWKKALLQLLPMALLVPLDYLLPTIDLRFLITLYPAALTIMLFSHIRAYRIRCEENYSSMDHIDAQWIVRYLSMVLLMGLSYIYILLSDNPGRVVTQNVLFVFIIAYSTEQILFRKSPLEELHTETAEENSEQQEISSAEQEKVEAWMQKEKPYLNPNFQLMDLRAVLPMNRTYLSQFVNSTYGCSFYQFANAYRVEEAKQLMQAHPEMKMAEVASRSGFASQAVFSQVFSKETGISPLKWNKERISGSDDIL